MAEQPASEYILGIDLGSNSLGWAIIGLIDGEPAQIARAGARVFEAGMDDTKGLGNEESRNKTRRDARLHRRLLWRRRRRLTKLFNLLQRYGLLPPPPVGLSPASGNGHRPPLRPEQRQDLLNELDRQILSSAWFQAKAGSGLFPQPGHTLPYILRAAALDEAIEPYFLGRALYHLAQRRGFLSNRKQAAKKSDDEGAVKEGIAELRKALQEKQARTLGEYLSHLDPAAERIRSRWTARDMYQNEFSAIWAAQAAHHPDLLAPERKKEIYNAIFYQRPLWFDPNTIGQCELEPGQRRAPAYLLSSQRFRLLQKVNDLQIELPGKLPRFLTAQERGKLSDALELQGDLSFHKSRRAKADIPSSVRDVLGLPKTASFNLQRGGEEKMPGNCTTAKLYAVFGERWLEMSAEEHEQAMQDILSIQKPATLKRRALDYWKLDEGTADKFCEISLESEYVNFSRKAIEKFLPLLEQGVPLATARKEIYPDSFKSGESKDLLPPVELALAEIRNPAVMRSLTELRKVVNATIRRYGKPTYVHVELARELKKSKKQRVAISENNRRNEKARADAARKIIAEAGITEPRPDDIRRFLLAEECHWMCPYTGKSISVRSLFGPEPQFDIEHILPFSRSMDNSFQNLTLCHVPENRSAKGNKTPHQAYSGDPARYEAILERVRKFGGDRQSLAAKLRRFTMGDDELEGFLDDFRSRQLNDTAYATSIAAKYLGLLFGGVIDPEGNRRVQATSGQATSSFRSLWKLNSILNDGPTTQGGHTPKSRDDHRHHAIDAVVIGLTDAAMIKRLSDAAQRAPLEHRRRFASLEAPWPNFVDSVRAEVGKIVVSHRVSKKVSGALHEETIYSRPFTVAPVSTPADRQSNAATEVRVRKPLASLTKPEVEKIADPGVRKLVQQKLEELGGAEPRKAFSNPENLPRFPSSGVPIKRVRISKAERPMVFGQGRSQRHVISGNNHHVEIYAELDEHGNEGNWGGEVVSMADAYQRLKARKPIVQRDYGPLGKFKFSLAPGEVVECDDNKHTRKLLVVRSVSEFTSGVIQIGFVKPTDARKKSDMIKSQGFIRIVPNRLREWHARKVDVSPTGEISEAYD
ncbi:MAG TPA: type II CRISPR RNA-guided endonuclease Cas9 [Terriglobia bacterium]|nr:type II CRISPR RNA-guided endonuclease Cas9 [Terriglobia bacterium]